MLPASLTQSFRCKKSELEQTFLVILTVPALYVETKCLLSCESIMPELSE
jgi:hypothetical protein